MDTLFVIVSILSVAAFFILLKEIKRLHWLIEKTVVLTSRDGFGVPKMKNPTLMPPYWNLPPCPRKMSDGLGCKKQDLKGEIFSLIDLIEDVDVVDYSFFPSDSHKSRSVQLVKDALKKKINQL